MILVPAEQPFTTCSARGQLISAHDGLSKRKMANEERLMGSVMASGRTGIHSVRTECFYFYNRSLRAAKRRVESAKKDFEGEKEKVLEVFGLEDHAFLHTKRSEVYNRDLRRKDLIHASVWEIGIQFWKNEPTRDTMLQMLEYNTTGDTVRQQLG